ncbi:MAG: long-chain fatty acid--CoA ligase [Rhodococcus sp.]|nr:long-chain fatty acid--CoA ligase [Rhodococcus sp. (in: high G+C Gram-positive bacteria)]
MNLTTILDMALAAHPDRAAVGPLRYSTTYLELNDHAARGGRVLTDLGARTVVFIGINGPALPTLAFSSAWAGIPLAPLNYRLSDDQLVALVQRLDRPVVVADDSYLPVFAGTDITTLSTGDFTSRLAAVEPLSAPAEVEEDAVAVILFTSGTTSAPKGVLLTHSNLASYVLQTVDLSSADETDAALISTPPYHIAGMGTILTNVYAGRRMVHLDDFSPRAWLEQVRTERISSAMVVPTMLTRIVDHLDGEPARTPELRSLAYGGARMPLPVLERALLAFPDTGFVNAYGLTETSSTISLLGPDDHRAALASDDPDLHARLTSVGRPVPSIEVALRNEDGTPAAPGHTGLLWVRGAQVSGQYLEQGSVLDSDGWFPTNDRARLDSGGYLFIEGRADDTIIRGGENIAPAEVEDAVLTHPHVADVAVVGLPDDEWGERIVAAVIPATGSAPTSDDIRSWTRDRVRGSRTPDDVVFVDDFPRTPTGKVIRRHLIADLTTTSLG